MGRISVKIRNLKRFEAAMRKSPKTVAKHLQKAISKSTLLFSKEAKDNIRTGRSMYKPPLDTGVMMNSIFPVITTLRGVVKVGSSKALNYASFVHEGTSKMQARPFFDITADTTSVEINNIFERGLNDAIKEVARG